jgi:hypothetical protein
MPPIGPLRPVAFGGQHFGDLPKALALASELRDPGDRRANPLSVAGRLGHTSTRMVERRYVSLFEGLDGEIGDRLGVMRGSRKAESERLRRAPREDAAALPRPDAIRALVTPLRREVE